MSYKDKIKQKSYQQTWYQRNKELCGLRFEILRYKQKIWFKEFRSKLSCSRCTETYYACLHFHHIDPTTKKANVSKLVHQVRSREQILEEIAKCEVLCANCHAKLHNEDADYEKILSQLEKQLAELTANKSNDTSVM